MSLLWQLKCSVLSLVEVEEQKLASGYSSQRQEKRLAFVISQRADFKTMKQTVLEDSVAASGLGFGRS